MIRMMFKSKILQYRLKILNYVTEHSLLYTMLPHVEVLRLLSALTASFALLQLQSLILLTQNLSSTPNLWFNWK